MSHLSRIVAAIVVPACLLSARPATAQQVVASIKSLDEVAASLKYLLALAGQEAQAAGIDQLRALFAGVDGTKPINACIDFPSTPGHPPTVCVVIPITDEAAFLNLLKTLRATATKGNDGLYEVAGTDGKTYAMKFAAGHAYVATDRARLTAPLPAPDSLRPAEAGTSLISAAVRLGEVSQTYRDQILKLLDGLVEMQKERKSGESEAQFRIRSALSAGFSRTVREVVADGKEITARLEVDRAQQQQLAWEISLTPKPGTALAEQIRQFADSRSMFSQLAADAAASAVLRLPLNQDFRKIAADFYKELGGQIVDGVADATARGLLEKLYNAIGAAAATDAVDVGAAVRGPFADGKFAFVAAANLGNGAELEKAVREILGDPVVRSVAEIALDADKHAGTAIHRIRVGQSDPNLERVFGPAEIHLAVRNDAVVFAYGVNGTAAIKAALEGAGKPAPLIAPPVQLEASVSRMLGLLVPDKADKAAAIARSIFSGADQYRDKVRFTVRGGDALRIRAEVHAAVLKAVTALQKAE